jgi:hypothetical protein
LFEDDTAALVAGRDQREERGDGEAVVGPDAELVDNEELGRQVRAHAAIEAMLGPRPAQILEEVLSPHDVDAEALLDGAQAEGDGEMCLADAGRNSHMLRSFHAPSLSTTAGIRSSAKR